MKLNPVTSDIWVVDIKTSSPLGRRMTVVRDVSGQLILCNGIFPDDTCAKEIEALGPVGYIPVQNQWHTLDTDPLSTRYPDAKVVGPKDLKNRLDKKCRITASFEQDWDLSGQVKVLVPAGLKDPEVVLFDERSGTLIVADMFFNFSSHSFTGLTKWMMMLNRANRFGITRIYRRFMIQDRNLFKAWWDDWLATNTPERVIVSHGEILDQAVLDQLRQAISDL